MSESPDRVRRPLPKWKKVLLVASVLAFVVGAGLHGFSYFSGGESSAADRELTTDPEKKSALNLNNSLVDGSAGTRSGGAAQGEEPGASDIMSPLLMQGGLSFFVGFCMAYALRTFFKISALFLGGALLLVFALQYFGVIERFDWASMDGHFQSLMASVSRQMAGFKEFVAGHLPSSAAATAGVFTGWKRN